MKIQKIIYLFIIFFANFLFSQNYKNGLSDGVLEVYSKKTPVKIFATMHPDSLLQENGKNIDTNLLIIINEQNLNWGENGNGQYSLYVLSSFKEKNFLFYDKNFQKLNAENLDYKSIQNIKYLYKSIDNQQIGGAKLKTKFKIWDPKTGISLGKFTLHFYSLMFLIAFILGYFLMAKIFKIDNESAKFLDPLLTLTIIGTLIGARLGHVIFYEPELFKQDFWSVFLPIKTKPHFELTGFSGLASHGATIALIFTTLYFSLKIIKKNPFWAYDRLGIVVAIGGAFVRLGNFINSEIIGKPVDENSFFAVLFPQQSTDYGVTVPRYPTQLFEAAGYVLLFILLWILYRKTDKKYRQGWLFGLFFVLLWNIRFLVEFLKEPQGDEIIKLGTLNSGQVLSIPFIIAGLLIMWFSRKFILKKINK